MRLTIRPVTPQLWPALEDLFGKFGASNGCWCMFWRIGGAYHDRPRDVNKAAFQEIVQKGPPPGLLAFDGELAVGWCQLTPRSSLPALDRSRYLKPVDDTPVWAISCFYVRRGYRKQGVTGALIAAALKHAKRAKAPAVEAYPVDPNQPDCPKIDYTGFASTFARAGFKTVAARIPSRPIMRYDLRPRKR